MIIYAIKFTTQHGKVFRFKDLSGLKLTNYNEHESDIVSKTLYINNVWMADSFISVTLTHYRLRANRNHLYLFRILFLYWPCHNNITSLLICLFTKGPFDHHQGNICDSSNDVCRLSLLHTRLKWPEIVLCLKLSSMSSEEESLNII